MKTLMPILFCSVMLLSSCGSKQAAKGGEDAVVNDTEIKSEELSEAKDCDEFVDQYDKWMDDYLKMIDKYMKNPMDATLSGEFMELAQEGMNWMTQWNDKLYHCASKEKYQKRFDEISEKAEKKLEEMGID